MVLGTQWSLKDPYTTNKGGVEAEKGLWWQGQMERESADAAVLALKMGSEVVDQRCRQPLAPGKGSALRRNQPSSDFPSAL